MDSNKVIEYIVIVLYISYCILKTVVTFAIVNIVLPYIILCCFILNYIVLLYFTLMDINKVNIILSQKCCIMLFKSNLQCCYIALYYSDNNND